MYGTIFFHIGFGEILPMTELHGKNRVLGAEKGAKIKTFFENLQKNLDNILKQLNFNQTTFS